MTKDEPLGAEDRGLERSLQVQISGALHTLEMKGEGKDAYAKAKIDCALSNRSRDHHELAPLDRHLLCGCHQLCDGTNGGGKLHIPSRSQHIQP